MTSAADRPDEIKLDVLHTPVTFAERACDLNCERSTAPPLRSP
jgi:hypothetical protein